MFALAVAFFIYVAARATLVPLTYDEAASYLRYVAADVLSTFSFVVATNHFLQTMLTRLSAVALGDAEVVLRLPSLAAYVIYLAFGSAILRRLRNGRLAVAGFVLLNANPYLLDYFGLARGYALSLALIVASVYYLLELVDPGSERHTLRTLERCLGAAALAVLANFSSLNAFLAIVAVALAGLRRRDRAQGLTRPAASSERTHVAWRVLWLPAAALMSLLVFSQDPDLSPRLFEPVTLTVGGLDEQQLETIRVVRLDTRGRGRRLERQGHTWRLPEAMHVASLRVEAPLPVAAAIDRIDTVIGSRVFTYSRTAPGPWRSSDAPGTHVLESGEALALTRPWTPALRGIINWRGDRAYLQVLSLHTLAAVAALSAAAALLWLAGGVFSRSGLVRRIEWNTVAAALCWVAAFAAAPLYLLTRKEELYFGGADGLIPDTLGSVVLGTLYGRGPAVPATTLGVGLLVILALLSVALCAVLARSDRQAAVPALSILAVLALVSTAASVQHHLLGTPYPVGRTAIIFIPLSVLFGILVLDAVSEWGRGAGSGALLVAAVAALAAVAHLAGTANLWVVRDWRHDASTKMMVQDLVRDGSARSAPKSAVSLGVAPIYFPVATYYANHVRSFTLAVTASTDPFSADYLYLQSGSQPPSSRILSAYPRTGTVLIASSDR